ncbi:hypothetical protein OS493_038840, partial [Desmophyllum pertusum]
LGSVLASRDVPFLHETEYNRNFINGLFVVEGTVDLVDVRQLIMARVVQNNEEPSCARMRKLIVQQFWRYVWQDEADFNIDKHVYQFEGTSPCNKEELQKMLSEHYSSPMRDDVFPVGDPSDASGPSGKGSDRHLYEDPSCNRRRIRRDWSVCQAHG